MLRPVFLQLEGMASAIVSQQVVAPALAQNAADVNLEVALNPVGATYNNLVPFQFGARVVVNTVGTVLPILMQFFVRPLLSCPSRSAVLTPRPQFVLAKNGVLEAFGIYWEAKFGTLLKWRLTCALVWTFLSAWSTVAWPLIFSESYGDDYASASLVFALWFVSWTYNFIMYCQLDLATSFLPPPGWPPVIITMIIFNVTSTVQPIELANNFFRIMYAFPAGAMWHTDLVIYSRGGLFGTLKWSAPVLAVWVVLSFAFEFVIAWWRERLAVKGMHEEAAKDDQIRDAVVAAHRAGEQAAQKRQEQ